MGGGLNDAVAAGQLPAENLKALLETIAGSGVELRCGVQADPQRLLEDGFAGVCAAVGRTGVNPWAALPGGEGVRSVLAPGGRGRRAQRAAYRCGGRCCHTNRDDA